MIDDNEDDVFATESFVNFILEDTALILEEIVFSNEEETWDIIEYNEDVAEFKLFCIKITASAAEAEFWLMTAYTCPKLSDIELDDIFPIWELTFDILCDKLFASEDEVFVILWFTI